MTIESLRREYHREICQQILFLRLGDVPNIADHLSRPSVALAQGIVKQLGYPLHETLPSGQTAGNTFEGITKNFLEKAFSLLDHLRPGKWQFSIKTTITNFDQYEHLADLMEILSQHKNLKATLGDYLIKPDIIISRIPVSDNEINQGNVVLDGEQVSRLTPFRANNSPTPKEILHASISCKWTIRSD
jgi:hypothetical protein